MSTQSPAGMRHATGVTRHLAFQGQRRTVIGRAAARCVWASLAALMALLLAPGAAYADPPHGHAFSGHFAAGHGPRGGHFGGAHWHAGGPARGAHWGGHGPQATWHAGSADRGNWRGGWHGGGHGGWQGDHRGDWHGDWRGDGWAGEHWHAGWGGRDWDHRDWRGAIWLGGDWGGLYWPPVDYGWNYPWFMASIPFGAMTLSFGGVPYYYINHVYYAWNPYYDGYVVTDPPPVADAASAAPPPPQASALPPVSSGRGVLSLRVTPLKGQSPQQAANDRYECNTWAVAQSGFNPLSAQQDAQASPQMRDGYRRAFTACLQARGYSVH